MINFYAIDYQTFSLIIELRLRNVYLEIDFLIATKRK